MSSYRRAMRNVTRRLFSPSPPLAHNRVITIGEIRFTIDTWHCNESTSLDRAISKFIFFSFCLLLRYRLTHGGERRVCETSTRRGAVSCPRPVVVILALPGAVLIMPALVAPQGVMSVVGQRKVARQLVRAGVYSDEGRGIYRGSGTLCKVLPASQRLLTRKSGGDRHGGIVYAHRSGGPFV
jgi:hypothetical protein